MYVYIYLLVCSHDEMSPFLHRPGGADLSVGDVGGNEAQQAFQKDLRTVVDVILLRGQFCQVILQTDTQMCLFGLELMKQTAVVVVITPLRWPFVLTIISMDTVTLLVDELCMIISVLCIIIL